MFPGRGDSPRRAVGAAPTRRQVRVGALIQHALAEEISRRGVSDPGLGALTVTITEVRVSPDLRQATVFALPLGGGRMDDAIAALTGSRASLRRILGRQLRLKWTPDLVFAPDRRFDRDAQIDQLLDSPAVARDLDRSDG